MPYSFSNADYTHPEYSRFELDAVINSMVRPAISDRPIDRRLEVLHITYLWRRDTNGNKHKIAIVTLWDHYQHVEKLIPILGEHYKTYMNFIAEYAGIKTIVEDGNMKAKEWHRRLRDAVDYDPLFVINAHRQPL